MRQYVDSRSANIFGVFSGVGWFEFATAEAFREHGIAAQVVGYCERDAVAASILSYMADATHNAAPIWDDIKTLDGNPWRGVVDCIVGGIPCPAYSTTGKHKGNTDWRAWGEDGKGPQYHFLRIIGEMQPAFVFMENVPEYVSGGHFRRLGQGLLDMGYLLPPCIFLSAAALGAPQRRKRVFIAAYRRDTVANAARKRLEIEDVSRHVAECHTELGLFPPEPASEKWDAILSMESPIAPAVEPGFSVVADGMAISGADLLKIGGNGVVPLAAAVAIFFLLDNIFRAP